jgi:hypothetical protein
LSAVSQREEQGVADCAFEMRNGVKWDILILQWCKTEIVWETYCPDSGVSLV